MLKMLSVWPSNEDKNTKYDVQSGRCPRILWKQSTGSSRTERRVQISLLQGTLTGKPLCLMVTLTTTT